MPANRIGSCYVNGVYRPELTNKAACESQLGYWVPPGADIKHHICYINSVPHPEVDSKRRCEELGGIWRKLDLEEVPVTRRPTRTAARSTTRKKLAKRKKPAKRKKHTGK